MTENIVQYSNEIHHRQSGSNIDSNVIQVNHNEEGEHIKIVEQLNYQRFRYDIEKRNAKKRREFPLMKLELTNIPAGSVMKLFCLDAHKDMVPHPNALTGQNCSNGIYVHAMFTNYIKSKMICIPYLQIRRVKSKQCTDELTPRLPHLPSPFNGHVDENHKFDTKMVRLCICIEVEKTSPILNMSSIIRSERDGAKVKIFRLSHVSVSARGTTQQNDPIFILTREDAPDLEAGDCEVYIEEQNNTGKCLWKSPIFRPKKADILYKHVIQYLVPEYKDHFIEKEVNVKLVLRCISTRESDDINFSYTPDPDLGLINTKKRKAEDLNKRKKWSCIQNSQSVFEPPEKLLRLSPEKDQENVKTKLKGKLTQNGRSDNGALLLKSDESNMTNVLLKETASQDIMGSMSPTDFLVTEALFETNRISPSHSIPPNNASIQSINGNVSSTESGESQSSTLTELMKGLECQQPHVCGKHEDCMVILKQEPTEERKDWVSQQVVADASQTEFPLKQSSMPRSPQGCPNTLPDKTCPAADDSFQMLNASTSEPSTGAAIFTNSKASVRQADKCTMMNKPTHAVFTKNEQSSERDDVVSVSSEVSSSSTELPIPSLSSDLLSMDLTNACSTLTSFINDPQAKGDNFEQNLNFERFKLSLS